MEFAISAYCIGVSPTQTLMDIKGALGFRANLTLMTKTRRIYVGNVEVVSSNLVAPTYSLATLWASSRPQRIATL